MGKPLFILLVIAGAWYGWNHFGSVDGAYDDNGEPLSLIHISEPTRLDLASRMPSAA